MTAPLCCDALCALKQVALVVAARFSSLADNGIGRARIAHLVKLSGAPDMRSNMARPVHVRLPGCAGRVEVHAAGAVLMLKRRRQHHAPAEETEILLLVYCPFTVALSLARQNTLDLCKGLKGFGRLQEPAIGVMWLFRIAQFAAVAELATVGFGQDCAQGVPVSAHGGAEVLPPLYR